MAGHYPTFKQDGVITYQNGSAYPYKAGERVTILSDYTTTQYFVLIEEGLAKKRMYYFDKDIINIPIEWINFKLPLHYVYIR